VFSGEFLMAVVVLLCGDDDKHVGAIELWHNDADRSHEMALVDGYCGTVDMFEFNSRHMKFPKGFGLSGRAWKVGMPLIIKDFHNSEAFLRWEEATEIGINCGVGIPYRTSPGQAWARP
jgi:hypothetical protein